MKKNQQQPPPARELKVAPHYIKSIDGRTVTGIASVFGNLDSYNDRIWPGAFTKTISERGSKVYHLWQHAMDQPAIAIIRSLREVGRTELPQVVLDAAPDATGGLEVAREYLDTPRANEVLLGLQAGITYEMSFAFDPVKYDFEEDENDSMWGAIRNLREVRLYETSDVLWGANAATVASKMPLQLLLRQLDGIIAEIKAGRRHSDGDLKLINQIAQSALDLGATNISLLEATDDDPADEPKAFDTSWLTTAYLDLVRLDI
jgi:HK97 family phage prohead protease